ncbi:MAG: chemotaxis-specific protein-glutamate methyltransferase CheB [Lachnospiraceae bacterium]|nr:chemotaxis-specific protein-glutamate methyltransferase CheB [Lachnospiraceae bacterium]
MKKKIIIVDDSALMRRMWRDIIDTDDRFEVADVAVNGAEGFKKIVTGKFDAVVLDVYMPQMTGLQMLREMQDSRVQANVLMASTTTREGARETMEALELGAIDFITKPENVADTRNDAFRERFLELLWVVANANPSSVRRTPAVAKPSTGHKTFEARYDVNIHTKQTDGNKPAPVTPAPRKTNYPKGTGKKIVAIASSTGGPKALQEVIPRLPKDLYAPVLLVQHMPKGFTQSLAEHLNDTSEVAVEEAKDNTRLDIGHVYVAQGGKHMKANRKSSNYVLSCTDEPAREGVKPCANYMFESLIDSGFDEIVCVVLTGMGCDGTEGIVNLSKAKKIHVIAQDESSSTVYGMPKSIAQTGLVNVVVPLDKVADQIIKEVGVQ